MYFAIRNVLLPSTAVLGSGISGASAGGSLFLTSSKIFSNCALSATYRVTNRGTSIHATHTFTGNGRFPLKEKWINFWGEKLKRKVYFAILSQLNRVSPAAVR